MTTTRVQANRSTTAGARPAAGARKTGELYVNLAELQLSVSDASKNPVDVLAVTFFSPTASYAVGRFVVNAGVLYVSNATVSPGAFNATQWTRIGP